MKELESKLTRMRVLLDERSVDALLIQRADNFAWATCGAASYVNQAANFGAASLLVTRSEQHLVTDNIEAPRLEQEEKLLAQGWEFHVAPWYQANHIVEDLTPNLKLGADGAHAGALDLSSALVSLRAALTTEETSRFRVLGTACGRAMDSAIRTVRPGMSEHEIAGRLAQEALSRGVQPTVNLIATDDRIYRYRHPLPTDSHLQKYAMLVLCGRKWGLVCSITRLVHFGRLSDELRRKAEAVARVDARLIQATRAGRSLRDIFQAAIEAYREVGFPDEWKLHHQGGLAGYAPREIIATPTCEGQVSGGQAYAWNPSITGVKSEDTIIVGEPANEVITGINGWPMLAVEAAGVTVGRPAILELT